MNVAMRGDDVSCLAGWEREGYVASGFTAALVATHASLSPNMPYGVDFNVGADLLRESFRGVNPLPQIRCANERTASGPGDFYPNPP